MVVLGAGCALFGVFLWWDLTRASRPIVARRFLRNRTVVTATVVGCFDFVRRGLFVKCVTDAQADVVLRNVHVPVLVRAHREALVSRRPMGPNMC